MCSQQMPACLITMSIVGKEGKRGKGKEGTGVERIGMSLRVIVAAGQREAFLVAACIGFRVCHAPHPRSLTR